MVSILLPGLLKAFNLHQSLHGSLIFEEASPERCQRKKRGRLCIFPSFSYARLICSAPPGGSETLTLPEADPARAGMQICPCLTLHSPLLQDHRQPQGMP